MKRIEEGTALVTSPLAFLCLSTDQPVLEKPQRDTGALLRLSSSLASAVVVLVLPSITTFKNDYGNHVPAH